MCYIATQGEADVLVYWWLSNLISYFLIIKEHLPRTPPLRNVKTTVHRNVGDEIVVNHFCMRGKRYSLVKNVPNAQKWNSTHNIGDAFCNSHIGE